MPPVLLLDVDGVLNPYAAAGCPPDHAEHALFPGEAPVRLCRAHGGWITGLGSRYELVWASAWGDEANRLLGPLLGLPRLPCVRFPPVPFAPELKVPAIAAHVGNRPAAWVDDLIPAAAYAWARSRATPTLLVEVDPAVGLTRATVDRLERWADDPR